MQQQVSDSLCPYHSSPSWFLPGGSDGKEFTCDAGDMGSTPGQGRSPEANSNPFQYSCLGRISWTEESRGLQSMESQNSWTQLSD